MNRLLLMSIICAAWLTQSPQALSQASGKIEIDFVDEQTLESLTCRVRIVGSDGRQLRGRGVLYEQGWNLVEGRLNFVGRRGDYQYQAFHGPQFAPASGGFTLDRNAVGQDTVRLPRHADLASEGWYGGDLLAHLPPEELLRWLPAEDLRMAVTPASGTGRSQIHSSREPQVEPTPWVETDSYRDDRRGSGITLHHWQPPAEVPEDLPSSRLIVMAKQAERSPEQRPVHVEIQRLWARDVPIWLASQQIDSIQLLSNHLAYDGSPSEQAELLVDPEPGRFLGPRRAGRVVEAIYWRVLEAGLRIPPSAGSGFGKSSSPLGYNRVYVQAEEDGAQAWWAGLRAGRTFVTSGPLLRASVNGEYPGHVFTTPAGSSLELDIALTLTVADPVEYLDVIFNGRTLYQARLDEFARQGAKIPLQEVSESGWLLIRVVTEREHTYRIASTAPYYIEVGGKRRISRKAIEFFQDWLGAAENELAQQSDAAVSQAEPYLRSAKHFWDRQAAVATAE